VTRQLHRTEQTAKAGKQNQRRQNTFKQIEQYSDLNIEHGHVTGGYSSTYDEGMLEGMLCVTGFSGSSSSSSVQVMRCDVMCVVSG
jgi:hypothetical protein